MCYMHCSGVSATNELVVSLCVLQSQLFLFFKYIFLIIYNIILLLAYMVTLVIVLLLVVS